MAYHLEPEQDVIFPGPGADVVDDEGIAACGPAVTHDTDVQDGAAQVPGHDVAE